MPLHNRHWTVSDTTPADLAARIAVKNNPHAMTYCGCQGWRVGPTLWLNDSTSGDGIQEYAVVHEGSGRMLDSITVGWCTTDQVEEYATHYANEIYTFKGRGSVTPNQIETPDQHGRCGHCA